VTSFRFPFILGPGNFADRESFVFGRLAAGRPILLPGGGDALNQFVYAHDVARAIVAALERPDAAGGQAYNCTHAKAITNRGWVELCADVLGVEARLVSIDEHELGVAAETVDLTNIVFPYPAEHYVLDGAKLTRELGVEMTTGNRRMIEEYAAWWLTRSETPPLRAYQRENGALTALGLPIV
jgi:nucleoside-diphosphate-sugar epimerase